ncbi:zinc-binding dehydrogenase [Nonomuraea spiralis]|uniref:Zinc-binding dehydrogenase n=1 Tax=Nonomuraea spiralis TaxID=46182 RepID=A0ABV5IWW0_9ACTN|nr:zinc-binding dehydrogenase [Nonomuraea spiralis]GGT21710.1 oxidoreductase [Nonomuraea spiralis]
MRALVVGPGAEGRFADVPEPAPGPGQALVEVHRTSINFSELRHMGRLPEGTVLGYDAAGVVLRAAADGTGPAEGTRVAAFGAGAWAERAAFDTGSIAAVPDGVDLAVAAALPMSGLTALRSLRAAGASPGSRVLVTGASGSVGRLAVQLARLAGAHVIASVNTPERARTLPPSVTAPPAEIAVGLDGVAPVEVVVGLDGVAPVEVVVGLDGVAPVEVVVGLDGVAPVDVVIEVVGGETLVAAWGLLKPGGNLQSVGWASGRPAVFPPGSTFSLGPARSLNSFGDVTSPGPDLTFLFDLVAAGRLSVEIGRRESWERLKQAAAAQLDRTITGKIVLDIAPADHVPS